MRSASSDRSGRGFDEFVIQLVWNKGQEIEGWDPAIWRRDIYGHAIRRSDYGRTSSEYGWEIDHIYPVAAGGNDELSNLQPLYWETNRAKADSV